ncbi:E3 ubiquitin-protein ligase APD2-like [Euphorbia lathyris]|uniref:E3 ubiquitin-protein ligase APD2-like n=1 Tax=Euphorbia lathyris TaxID=212925 RepID=UPI003313DD55
MEEEEDAPVSPLDFPSTSQLEDEPSSLSSPVSYRVNMAATTTSEIWSCLVLLITFCFFASITFIFGFYASANLELGPYSSRLINSNPFFVHYIQAQQEDEQKPGAMLYGFYKPPPMDVQINWTQTHNTIVPVDVHKEWFYYLNKGSKIHIFYSIKSPTSSPLSLVIAQGRESFLQWIDEPSYPNSTLSWNIILESGNIELEIPKSSNYYIALGNLNSQDVQIELKFIMTALNYNTAQAYYKCSLNHNLCSFKLFLLGTTVAVLTSSGPKEGALDNDWFVKISYGPRWITYFIVSGIMSILILLILRFWNMFQEPTGHGNETVDLRSERASLLSTKDDDISSWGSSYDSIPDQDLDDLHVMNSVDGKAVAEGENLNRICVICFDAPRDCFFLPCGHCAACFTCGTRIAEEGGTCPICRRSMKKVRKIFSV